MQYVFYRHILRAGVNFTDPGNHQTLHFKDHNFRQTDIKCYILKFTLKETAAQSCDPLSEIG
jgi:hypothetical protein